MNGARLNLRALDMLRGMLAIYVLLGHCRWLLWIGHATWMSTPHSVWLEPLVFASASLRYGTEAVMVFFVVSGFFIHLRAASALDRLPAAGAAVFYRRRFHRLAAPYAAALALTMIADTIGRSAWPALYAAHTGDPFVNAAFGRTGYGWRSTIPAIAGLPSSLGYDFGTNAPLWSLGYEVVYYAAYPAWLALRRSSAAAAYGVVTIACLLSEFVPAPPFISSVMAYYPVWLTGALLAEWLPRRRVRLPLIGLGVLAAIGFAVRASAGPSLFVAAPVMIFGGAIVAACATLDVRVLRYWPARTFEYLGLRSYSIYLMHYPVIALISAALFATSGRPLHGWFAIAGAMAGVAVGCVCFELCEKRFMHQRTPEIEAAA